MGCDAERAGTTHGPRAVVNGFVQQVEYDDSVVLPLVSSPAQFDRTPNPLSGP